MHPDAPSLDLTALVAGRSPSEQEKRVAATRKGLRILILAVLLQWVPLVEYLGLMVGAVGVFYVVRGRKAFGLRYERMVLSAVILFVAAEVAAFALDNEFHYALDVVLYAYTGPDAARAAIAAYDGLAVGTMAVAVSLAASYVVLAFDLEDRPGRWWLLVGLASQVAASATLCVAVLLPMVEQAVPLAYSTSPPDSTALASVEAEIRGVSLLRWYELVPAGVLAWAYWRAVLRIDRGQLPGRRTSPPSTGPS